MIKILKIVFFILLAALLTLLTQVGGVILLLSFTAHNWIERKFSGFWMKIGMKWLAFLILYFTSVFIFVPMAAKLYGKVPLPMLETHNLRPLNIWTCLLNRNYVKVELRDITYTVAAEMNRKHPGTVVNYLDANFPLFKKFALQPHLSHNDGKKLDLSFCYRDKSGKLTNDCPSAIGYGICEGPLSGEFNRPDVCKGQGYWQYGMLEEVIPQGSKAAFEFDQDRTRDLVNFFASEPGIVRILIEPHLKTRLNLISSKIRLHGCQAVRHDDHFHIQLR